MESSGIDRDGAAAQQAALQWTGVVLLVLVPAFVLADGFGHHWVMVPAGAVLGFVSSCSSAGLRAGR